MPAAHRLGTPVHRPVPRGWVGRPSYAKPAAAWLPGRDAAVHDGLCVIRSPIFGPVQRRELSGRSVTSADGVGSSQALLGRPGSLDAGQRVSFARSAATGYRQRDDAVPSPCSGFASTRLDASRRSSVLGLKASPSKRDRSAPSRTPRASR